MTLNPAMRWVINLTSLFVLCEYSESPEQKLSVPQAVVSMFGDRLYHPKPNNDSASHQGRTRLFEHERGNWATYVYVPCQSPFVSCRSIVK